MDDVRPAPVSPPSVPPPAEAAPGPHRGVVLACLMLSLFMAAVEATVVSTAMPRIVASLGGFSLYSWVFSAFLMPQAITAILYGKIADLYGRRPALVFGIIVFLFGSIACGFADSMPTLIVFRLIQGIGAGAILPVATTIAGDLYAGGERARVQGYLAGIWGLAALIGPLVGGVIVETLSWRWIFWINVPFGVVTVIGLIAYYHENLKRQAHRLDFAGAAFFTISVTSLLLVLIQGGRQWPWNSAPVYGLVATFVASLALFLWQENRASEPILSLGLWKQRLVAVANGATMIAGMGIIGVGALIPTYVQGVMGDSAIVAGFSVTSLSVAWSISSGLFAQFANRVGARGAAQIGSGCCLAGGAVFCILTPGITPVMPGIGSFLFGFGMGLLTTTATVMIQSSVDWSKRGSATASNIFSRLLGSTLGAAILGGVLNNTLQRELNGSGLSNVTIDSIRELLERKTAGNFDPKQFAVLHDALHIGLHNAFLAVLAVSALSLVLTLFLPKKTLGSF